MPEHEAVVSLQVKTRCLHMEWCTHNMVPFYQCKSNEKNILALYNVRDEHPHQTVVFLTSLNIHRKILGLPKADGCFAVVNKYQDFNEDQIFGLPRIKGAHTTE